MRIPRRHRPLLASVAALVALYGVAALRYGDDGFFTLQVFINLLRNNSVLGIVAVGMTFVILSGGIDLSVGAMMSLSSVVVGVLITECHWPPVLAIPAALALGTAVGLGMGCIIRFTGIKPFIVTLAGMFFARGLGFLIHLESVSIYHPHHEWLALLAIPLGDPESRETCLLPITAILFLGVVLVGAYTSLAGVVLTLELSSGSHIEGVALELDAIAAVVVGGTLLTGGVGSVFGTLIGVLIIGIILNVMTYEDFSAGLTKVAIGLLLLVFVVLQRLLTRGAARPA